MTTYLSSLNVNYKREFRRNVKQASERASEQVLTFGVRLSIDIRK